MAINYIVYIRRRMEGLERALRTDALTSHTLADDGTVQWMLETADEIRDLCARIEPEEWRYQWLEPTAPPH